MLSVLLSVLLSVQKKTCVADIAFDRFPLSLPSEDHDDHGTGKYLLLNSLLQFFCENNDRWNNMITFASSR